MAGIQRLRGWLKQAELRAAIAGARVVPAQVRYWIQSFVSLTDIKLRLRAEEDPLSQVLRGDENFSGCDLKCVILKNPAFYHSYFVAACLEIGVPFRVVDVLADDWDAAIQREEPDFVLVWPDATISTWASTIKDRVSLIESELRLPVFPTSRELWFYEDKVRLADWLRVHRLPHPRTWVFVRDHEAAAFAEGCDLPVVFKAPFGAASSGVRIVRSRRQLSRLVRSTFARGFIPSGMDRDDRQRGRLILQEYLPGVREWRVVRIGNSFFCRVKQAVGGYHSGSGIVSWARPTTEMLEFVEQVTNEAGFSSMAADLFETKDGDLLINELQAVIGGIRESNRFRGESDEGRWRRRVDRGGWTFEAGDFYRNACANERLQFILGALVQREQTDESEGA